MMNIVAILCLSVVLASVAGDASAQIVIGPQDGGAGGVVIGQPVIPAPAPSTPPAGYGSPRRNEGFEVYRGSGLTDRDAVRIARARGLREVDEVVRRGGVYRVEGADAYGDPIEVVVDRRTGRVLSVR